MHFHKFFIFSLIFCILCLMACSGSSQNNTPEAVKKSFKEKYPSEKVEWSKDTHGNHEAAFEKDGEKYRADFEPSGKWIETENSVKFDDLPKAVKETIKEKFDKDDVVEIELVDHHSKGQFYDIEFRQKGKNHDVEVSPQGRIIGQDK